MKLISIILAASLMLSVTACGAKNGSAELTTETTSFSETGSEIDRLRAKYPEYFKLNTFKGIEVYVWQMAENSYYCGLMSGTDRNKTEEEIWDLHKKPLTIEEAKLILKEHGVDKDGYVVIPVVQPYSSYYYEIDDAYRAKVKKLFE